MNNKYNMGQIMKMIIAGIYHEWNIAKEVEEIFEVSLIGSRMRELSNNNKLL
jgi:hypothetical protein